MLNLEINYELEWLLTLPELKVILRGEEAKQAPAQRVPGEQPSCAHQHEMLKQTPTALLVKHSFMGSRALDGGGREHQRFS